MNRFLISTRLIFSFSLLSILLAVLGGVALLGASAQRTALAEISKRQIPLLQAMNAITDGVNEQAIQLRNLALFTSDDIQKASRERIKSARTEVSTQIDALHRLIQSDEGKTILGRLLEARTTYIKHSDEYVKLVDQNQREEAVQILETQLRPALRAYRDLVYELIAHQTKSSDKATARAEDAGEQLAQHVLITGVIAIAAAIFLAWNIICSITRPISRAVQMADRVASGDLSGQILVDSKDEMGQLLGALARMQQSLVTTVRSVRSSAQGVASASEQIAAANHDLSGRTEVQASALEETAASMEQLGSTVQFNAENARQANQMAQAASAVAAQGGEVVAEVVETMKNIDDSSHRIADIIGVIDSIAFQTNILALNAAVEAARAGEQGRGFAVVATEVRALAQRSAAAAKEIKQLISTSVDHAAQGSQLANKAGDTMTEVVAAIRRVTHIMGEISAASHEQSAGVSQAGSAVTQMDQTTQQNASLVEEMAAAASTLSQQAQVLVQTVAVFTLDDNPSLAETVSTDRVQLLLGKPGEGLRKLL